MLKEKEGADFWTFIWSTKKSLQAQDITAAEKVYIMTNMRPGKLKTLLTFT